MKNVKTDQMKKKTEKQLATALKKAFARQYELLISLRQKSPIKEGDVVEFKDLDEIMRKGKVMKVSVGNLLAKQIFYTYDVLLFKKNGELGTRKSYFTVDIG